MKKIIGSILLVSVLIGCNQGGDKTETVKEPSVMIEEDNKKFELSMEITEQEARFPLDELMEIVDGTYVYDEVHRTLTISINDESFYLIDGVNVLERNGEYIADEDIYLIVEEEAIYLPAAFLTNGLGLPIEYKESKMAFEWLGPVQRAGGPPPGFHFEDWTAEEMIEYLSFLEKPIKNAQVSTIPSHLPGARRPYRNGYHEGLDWYDFASGGNISKDTPVYGMGQGVVVRADHDYVEYESPEVRNVDLSITAELGETPAYIFDRLRGRQVWVQYENGVMCRFAHLSDIPEDIKVGKVIDENTIIGYVGNSGTSGAVNQDLTELHLHQDILIYGELFWKPLSQEEVREVLVAIFD